MSGTVLFLGGNGHAAARLEPARRALRARSEPFELIDLPYPPADSFDELLERLAESVERSGSTGSTRLIYATGIGGLVALAQRVRGAWLDMPLLLQGAVLWGLEQRMFPKLMRIGPAPYLLAALLRTSPIRRRFVKKHFLREHDATFVQAFFDGYGDAQSFASWFDWLRPELLRRLERDLAGRPDLLQDVSAWWGGRDTVVGVEELHRTEAALGIRVPCTVMPDWGHYPMIDDPDGWVEELARVVA